MIRVEIGVFPWGKPDSLGNVLTYEAAQSLAAQLSGKTAKSGGEPAITVHITTVEMEKTGADEGYLRISGDVVDFISRGQVLPCSSCIEQVEAFLKEFPSMEYRNERDDS